MENYIRNNNSKTFFFLLTSSILFKNLKICGMYSKRRIIMNVTFQSKRHSHISIVLNFHLHGINCVRAWKDGQTKQIQKHFSTSLERVKKGRKMCDGC